MEITEDRIRIIIREELGTFIKQHCDLREEQCNERHEKLDDDRDKRGVEIDKLESSVIELTKIMDGKFIRVEERFTKQMYILIALLASIITTFVAVLLK